MRNNTVPTYYSRSSAARRGRGRGGVRASLGDPGSLADEVAPETQTPGLEGLGERRNEN